jgi:hypothetical protein
MAGPGPAWRQCSATATAASRLTRPSAALIQSNGQPLTIVYNGRNHYYSTSPL